MKTLNSFWGDSLAGRQFETLYDWATLGQKIPIYDISEGRSERVKINGKYPEGDFDLEKGENLSDNDYSD